MQLQQLNSQNSCYKPELFNRYRCLYNGGVLFRENIKKFLLKNNNEEQTVYLRRCQESSYRSYVGPIIDHFGSQVFTAPYCIRPTQSNQKDGYGNPSLVDNLDEFYPEFKEDCDLKGTDLSSFMKHQLITSLVLGKSYWLIDLPEKSEEIKTLADYQENDLGRARLVDIEPESVIDYEIDDFGEFEYVVLHYKEYRRPTILDSRNICTETWKIYFTDHVEIYQIVYDPKKKQLKPTDEITLIDSFQHSFNKVPIICMDLPMGFWLMDRVAEAQIQHFRLSAALGWSLLRSAYPMIVFNIKDNDSLPNTGAGQGIIMNIDEKASYVEPGGSSYSVLQKEINDQKDEIYRVSQQMANSADNSAGSLGRSGESKVQDQQATEICCKTYGTIVREAIEKTFELISDARGDENIKFSIEGLNQYSFADPTIVIANAQQLKALSIPSETFYKELNSQLVEASLKPDTKQEVKDKIRQEIESAKNKPEPIMDQVSPKLPFDKKDDDKLDDKSKIPTNLQ